MITKNITDTSDKEGHGLSPSLEYGVFYSDHDTVLCVDMQLHIVVIVPVQNSNSFLNRDDDNYNIGSVLSPHDVRLMKVVDLRKIEGSNLLLLRYSVL